MGRRPRAKIAEVSQLPGDAAAGDVLHRKCLPAGASLAIIRRFLVLHHADAFESDEADDRIAPFPARTSTRMIVFRSSLVMRWLEDSDRPGSSLNRAAAS
jgi:hypothetical protein